MKDFQAQLVFSFPSNLYGTVKVQWLRVYTVPISAQKLPIISWQSLVTRPNLHVTHVKTKGFVNLPSFRTLGLMPERIDHSLTFWARWISKKKSCLTKVRHSFSGLRMDLFQSEIRIQGVLWFPAYYTTFSTYDKSLVYRWFPAGNCYRLETIEGQNLLRLPKPFYKRTNSHACHRPVQSTFHKE